MGYSFRLSANVILYALSHGQDNTYHGLCYTSRGALAGTRNSSMGSPWRIEPTTHRTISERSYHGATSRSDRLIPLSKPFVCWTTEVVGFLWGESGGGGGGGGREGSSFSCRLQRRSEQVTPLQLYSSYTNHTSIFCPPSLCYQTFLFTPFSLALLVPVCPNTHPISFHCVGSSFNINT